MFTLTFNVSKTSVTQLPFIAYRTAATNSSPASLFAFS